MEFHPSCSLPNIINHHIVNPFYNDYYTGLNKQIKTRIFYNLILLLPEKWHQSQNLMLKNLPFFPVIYCGGIQKKMTAKCPGRVKKTLIKYG